VPHDRDRGRCGQEQLGAAVVAATSGAAEHQHSGRGVWPARRKALLRLGTPPIAAAAGARVHRELAALRPRLCWDGCRPYDPARPPATTTTLPSSRDEAAAQAESGAKEQQESDTARETSSPPPPPQQPEDEQQDDEE
jgi:hypothetical protein